MRLRSNFTRFQLQAKRKNLIFCLLATYAHFYHSIQFISIWSFEYRVQFFSDAACRGHLTGKINQSYTYLQMEPDDAFYKYGANWLHSIKVIVFIALGIYMVTPSF